MFADDHPDRFDDRWSDFVGVGALRRRTYVNCGLVVLPPRLGLEVLLDLRALQTRLAHLGHTQISGRRSLPPVLVSRSGLVERGPVGDRRRRRHEGLAARARAVPARASDRCRPQDVDLPYRGRRASLPPAPHRAQTLARAAPGERLHQAPAAAAVRRGRRRAPRSIRASGWARAGCARGGRALAVAARARGAQAQAPGPRSISASISMSEPRLSCTFSSHQVAPARS